ncbi:glycosyltransferase family A protein [Adlercreutzia murintestinalis]|jgi:Glycosyltransferases involved in cell wall biogenesis|uniref:glycosyltransferase family A protein n=1 Tax=Adlercreutzia murintestinalis TaxID=2941325 RepID=UPI00203A82F7|nr:glycosyltransferase family A protein [Adlercreutzia murintestinalis]
MTDHTFAICAYKESPYLEECIVSLKNQEDPSNLIICTSTPNEHIRSSAQRFEIPLFVNPNGPGIASDWNFALEQAMTPYVTIAHQDDVYASAYSTHMRKAMCSMSTPLLFFTDYGEIRNEKTVTESRLLTVKRRLLAPLCDGQRASSKKARRRALSLGSAICCPSVTLAMNNIPKPVFKDNMKSNLDWQAWSEIALLDGQFYYDSEILMFHRIHPDSETSALIVDDTRTAEDLFMLSQFWPRPIAKVLNHFYQNGQKSNDLDNRAEESSRSQETEETR